MPIQQFHGSCHCGEIKFTFPGLKIVSAMRCNCSICRRKGHALTSFVVNPDEIKVYDDKQLLQQYQFGSQTAKHYFCRQCGISPFVQTRLNPDCYRINLGCIEGLDLSDLEYKNYDGEDLI